MKNVPEVQIDKDGTDNAQVHEDVFAYIQRDDNNYLIKQKDDERFRPFNGTDFKDKFDWRFKEGLTEFKLAEKYGDEHVEVQLEDLRYPDGYTIVKSKILYNTHSQRISNQSLVAKVIQENSSMEDQNCSCT